MLTYVVQQILITLPILLLVALVSFGIVSLLLGDFDTSGMLGAALMGIDPHDWHDSMRVMRGIDKPWIVQFWIWIEGVVFELGLWEKFQGLAFRQ